MATVVTINRPDVVALVEALADRLTAGNKTEVVAMALQNLQMRDARSGSLFGAQPGSVIVREGIDLTAPILEDEMDADRAAPPWRTRCSSTRTSCSGLSPGIRG